MTSTKTTILYSKQSHSSLPPSSILSHVSVSTEEVTTIGMTLIVAPPELSTFLMEERGRELLLLLLLLLQFIAVVVYDVEGGAGGGGGGRSVVSIGEG